MDKGVKDILPIKKQETQSTKTIPIKEEEMLDFISLSAKQQQQQLKRIEKKMLASAKKLDFEQAAALRPTRSTQRHHVQTGLKN